jgi:2-aminoadipate transaminase
MNNLQKPTSTVPYEGFFSERMSDVPRSFIREILKIAVSRDIISFAGGLPNRELFPVEALKESAIRVFDNFGKDALQYSNTEGYLPLREYIAKYYYNRLGLHINEKNILITSGSQQGLDLLGKIIINQGDGVIIEEPGYLGAIQAFSCYRPHFLPVTMNNDGIDSEVLNTILTLHHPKFIYTVPEFQNPSGISYSKQVRHKVAELLLRYKVLLIEDNPYMEIRFTDTPYSSFYQIIPEQTVLLGTFSKTAVPGMRLGWIVAPDTIMDKLIVAKQAADLHSNNFIQYLLYDYLMHNEIEDHIKLISRVYGEQCNAMIRAMEEFFPGDVKYTKPAGGMFLWATLPGEIDSIKLLKLALLNKVAFVPGNPFYTDKRKYCAGMRLNFSCSDIQTTRLGIQRLSQSLREILNS